MFFILSKTLSYLFMPLTVVFICFLISVFIKHPQWKKKMFWCGLILLWFFSNEFISNELMRAWEIPATLFKDMPKHKIGIVLTGSTIPLEPNDRVYFQRGADRVVHTVQLYKMGLLEKILISGGSGRLIETDEREADAFKKVMLLMEVPEEDILTESETRNTHESAVAVKAMLDTLHYQAKDCVLITSAFHMRRSLACYQKVGLALDCFTTDFYSHPRKFHFDTLLLPKLDALNTWNKLFKEWLGMVAYKLAGYS
jgi:uncharacterized SAM-binding protein YcdF (DUF218 family)